MSTPLARMQYLAHYPEELQDQVRALIDAGRLGPLLASRYPSKHEIQSSPALYDYVMAIKRAKMASSPPLSKVVYCEKISTLNQALGTHTYATRVQGGKLKTKPLHPALLPLLRKVTGPHTVNVGTSHSARQWRLLFDKLGMKHTFQSLRISFVSRCRRAGIDRLTCLQLADHASATVHQIYNRWADSDLRSALAKLEFPKPH